MTRATRFCASAGAGSSSKNAAATAPTKARQLLKAPVRQPPKNGAILVFLMNEKCLPSCPAQHGQSFSCTRAKSFGASDDAPLATLPPRAIPCARRRKFAKCRPVRSGRYIDTTKSALADQGLALTAHV